MNRSQILGKLILKKLIESGYEAYFVGGFVRDYLLNIDSSDIDITTNATPEEVERLFPSTKATGKKYGTVTVYMEDHKFEVTTYRIDQKYLNHRKPESVVYSLKLEEDLKRRDFTINALAMDYDEQIIDLFNGQDDLNRGVIRAIGNPDERFKEDALRIIRALRFVSRFGFKIEGETLASMKDYASKIKVLPNERIIPELEDLFNNPYQKQATVYMDKILFGKVFPELEKGIARYNQSPITLNLYEFMALCFYLEKVDIPDYWRLSNKEKILIYKLIHILGVTHNCHYNPSLVYKLGLEICLIANRISQIIMPYCNQEEAIRHIYLTLTIKSRDQLKINGFDIKNLQKISDDEMIGDILEEIEFQVINRHLENEFDELINYAKKLMERLHG
ncbi:MAG: CCA tRNA nucleotidyltransferase [Candidatus Izemoplasmatales bacterium]